MLASSGNRKSGSHHCRRVFLGMGNEATRRFWAVPRARSVFAVEFNKTLQKIDGAGAGENTLVEALGISGCEDDRYRPNRA